MPHGPRHFLSIKRFVTIISSLLFDCLVIKKEDKSLRKKLMKLWTKRIKRHEETDEALDKTNQEARRKCKEIQNNRYTVTHHTQDIVISEARKS